MRENAVWIPVRPKPNAFPADARSIPLLFQNIPRCKKAEKEHCNTEAIENLTVPGQKKQSRLNSLLCFFLVGQYSRCAICRISFGTAPGDLIQIALANVNTHRKKAGLVRYLQQLGNVRYRQVLPRTLLQNGRLYCALCCSHNISVQISPLYMAKTSRA